MARGRIFTIVLAVGCALAIGAFVLVAGADPDGPRRAAATTAPAGCGTASATTVAAVQTLVAKRIYAGELRGTETLLDAARVRGYGPLLAALESGQPAAVAGAVHALVYKPHWHIVRLRVLRGNRVMADVGGPYVTAPVSGTLRAHGRQLGRYVMSVQDDLGYVKLVTRFIGVPIELYQHGSVVMGTLHPAPPAPQDRATVRAAGTSYLVRNLALRAFPESPLQASLFVPAAWSARSCTALRLATWGDVARHVAARLHPLSAHYQDLAGVLRAVSGGRVLVRAGSRQLVGGGPRRLPLTGPVRYAGTRWQVYSWAPQAGQRVYFLTPPG
jgi:hypothetical protein